MPRCHGSSPGIDNRGQSWQDRPIVQTNRRWRLEDMEPIKTPREPAAAPAPAVAMVSEQIEARGVSDPVVLGAMRRVARHKFVPVDLRKFAYDDNALPIGAEQTISQPFIVAFMTDLLQITPGQRVLEIGTGSGYQAAVLAELGAEVYSIEIIAKLAESARTLLTHLGYTTIHVRAGDGFPGWPEAAPFDGIVVTAAPPLVPHPLIDQLKPGGRLVVPEGVGEQNLAVYTKARDGRLRRATVLAVRFVPMTGRAQSEK